MRNQLFPLRVPIRSLNTFAIESTVDIKDSKTWFPATSPGLSKLQIYFL